MNPPLVSEAARRCRWRRSLWSQRGAGLIEVLIAVLVLSIGLLGIAMVQTRSLSGNNSAAARSAAIIASYSILDAMRADRAAAQAGSYNGTVTAGSSSGAAACPGSGGTRAEENLRLWCIELGATLGVIDTTKGIIACDTAGTCTVTVQFDDSNIGTGGSTAQQVITKAML